MSAHKTTDRRKVLIGLGGGMIGASQLPQSWTKPIVDAVILPSHAATTDDSGNLPPENTTAEPAITDFSGNLTFLDTTGSTDNNSLMDNALSMLIPDAYAGYRPAEGEMCIKVTPPVDSGANYTARALLIRGNNSAVYEGSGTINGGPTVLTFVNGCQNESPTLTVTSISNAGAVYTISASGGNAAGTLAPGSVCPDDSNCD